MLETELSSRPIAPAPPRIERRSIEWVPNEERRGSLRSVGALWFVSNINLTAMATGTAALAVGGGLLWTVIATIAGSLFGTFFMAFHSAQGPQLGLPQLVQSRPQFGYRGAAITIFIAALVNYVAYNTSDALLSGSATQLLFNIPSRLGYTIAAVVAALLALFGYHWIHRVNRWLALPLVVIMAALSVAALTNHALPAGVWNLGEFKPAAFMTVFGTVRVRLLAIPSCQRRRAFELLVDLPLERHLRNLGIRTRCRDVRGGAEG
jgi:NCS1 family nucleobase:cation symporter-1